MIFSINVKLDKSTEVNWISLIIGMMQKWTLTLSYMQTEFGDSLFWTRFGNPKAAEKNLCIWSCPNWNSFVIGSF